MQTLKTKIHTYSYNTHDPDDAKAYAELRERLNDGRDWMNAWAHDGRGKEYFPPDGTEIELETECLFSNQWNTSTHRVFDWYEGTYHNRAYKRGHWLEITDEMREIREKTLACGYCGKLYRDTPEPPQYLTIVADDTPAAFCSSCLDSAYLGDSDLFLTRLLPVAEHYPDRPKLTDAQRDALMPLYIERQTTGKTSRALYLGKDMARLIQNHDPFQFADDQSDWTEPLAAMLASLNGEP